MGPLTLLCQGVPVKELGERVPGFNLTFDRVVRLLEKHPSFSGDARPGRSPNGSALTPRDHSSNTTDLLVPPSAGAQRMSGPSSRRTMVWMFTTMVVAVSVVVLSFVWPGFLLPTHCEQPPGLLGPPTESVNDHTYCATTVLLSTLPYVHCPHAANGTWSGSSLGTDFLGFTFHLAVYTCESAGGTVVSVTEPNGKTVSGLTEFGGPVYSQLTSWFSPDNEAGISEPTFPTNITLYVEAGT